MEVKTLKNIRVSSNMGHIRGKNNKKSINWSVVANLLQKSPNATLTKLYSSKRYILGT